MKKQNTSHAVMAKRFEENDSLDDFPIMWSEFSLHGAGKWGYI